MKPLNRKSATILLVIAEAIIFIPLLVLLARDKISALAFVISFFIVGMITLAAVVAILYKFPFIEEKAVFDPDSVKVPRTPESTIVEITSGFFLLGALVMGVITHEFTTFAGIFLISTFLLIDAYMPSTITLVGKLRNARQVVLAVRMNRILALALSLMCVLLVAPKGLIPEWILVALLVIILGIYVFFRILIYRAKN